MKCEGIKILIVVLLFQMSKVGYITNYKVMYDIIEKDENLCKLVEERETNYYIFKGISELAKNSFVVTYERWFDVENIINVKKRIYCFMIYQQN